MTLGPPYVLLGEVSVQVLCPLLIGLFVFLVWSHVSSLYILQIKPLSEVSLGNTFSHMVGSLFILLTLRILKHQFKEPIGCKEPMHPNVHSYIIYNSQVLETA